MDQWLDSLSEDWVSQPRSQHSSSVLKESLSAGSQGSQSRIPRYMSGTTSRPPSRLSTTGQKDVLKPRTQSELNSSLHKRGASGSFKTSSPIPSERQQRKQEASPLSKPPTLQGTVQYKSSPTKDCDLKGTPEWKRRILKGDVGKGDQTDLFNPSPTGLQGVFKPPTVAKRSPQKDLGKRRAQRVEGLPSKLAQRPAKNNERSLSLEVGVDKAPQGLAKVATLEKRPPSQNSPLLLSSKAEDGHSSVAPNENDDGKSDNFSPVYVSKQTTVDGHVKYTAKEISGQRIGSNTHEPRIQQQNVSAAIGGPGKVSLNAASSKISSTLRPEIDDITSQSLPDDLSVGTDVFAANGGFVSVERGGCSNEGSLYRRSLSPSSSVPDLDGASMEPPLARENLKSQVHSTISERQPAPVSPKTPQKHRKGTQSSPERPRSSGSPLKLFDTYDTFTNDRLARRMSKFEETLGQEERENESPANDEHPPSPRLHPKSPPTPRFRTGQGEHRNGRRVSSFGDGELDLYAFPHPDQREPSLPQLPRQHPLPSDNISPKIFTQPRSKRKTSVRSSHARGKDHPSHRDNSILVDSHTQSHRDDPSKSQLVEQPCSQSDVRWTEQGKRLPASPAKDPASKRRRTIHSSEERRKAERLIHGNGASQEPQSKPFLGRKRKDALYDSEQQVADPRVLAMRQIRRPRNPTPNQAPESATNPSTKPAESLAKREGGAKQDIQTTIDPPTQIVAGALATIAINTVQDITCGSRKASVTTADFFSEAQQIMKLIRAEKRPRSSHTSVDVHAVERPTIHEESSMIESTQDDFSRPPSREGGKPSKLQAPIQPDARVVSHLRKFEDEDDLGLALSSSLKSLRISRSRTASDASVLQNKTSLDDDDHESDPPNIRILDRVSESHFGEQVSSSTALKTSSSHKIDSQGSAGLSTKRSIPTGSSGSSGNRIHIAPETVAHLLSDQMAGMVFDRQKQMWIKRKGSVRIKHLDVNDSAASESSEEDLFCNIPDLSVDEMDELKRVQEAVSAGSSMGSATDKVSHQDHKPAHSCDAPPPCTAEESADIRPRTAEGKALLPVEDSSAPSKYSHFASSGPGPSTRATSWGEEFLPLKSLAMQAPNLPVVDEDTHQDHGEGIEHEISILEGRSAKTTDRQIERHRQPRAVTVAFSSPLVEQKEAPEPCEIWEGNEEPPCEGTPTRFTPKPRSSTKRPTSAGFGLRSFYRDASRKMSISNQSYIAKPMSRLDEHEEMSIVQYSVKGNRTMDIAISTPLPLSKSFVGPPTTAQYSSVGFHLSPLPDFTVHQIDRPVDVELGTLARAPASKSFTETNEKLSITAQGLVKHLTDVEPYEPYWEYIRSIDLRARGLTSLHMLDEFCSQAEELDVSDNQLGELNGMPSTIRLLNIRHNCLSDLAAWHHLQHLQYLDISGNELTTLKGLQGLFHLRALKADENMISGLEGLEDLDGLLSLRLRGNRLRAVDFVCYGL